MKRYKVSYVTTLEHAWYTDAKNAEEARTWVIDNLRVGTAPKPKVTELDITAWDVEEQK